jgi:hypothetical protein
MAKDDWYFVCSTILAILALLGTDWKVVMGNINIQSGRFR